MISSLPWSLDFLFSAPFWITSHNSFLLQPPFTISAPTIILWHSYSLPSLVSLLPTPPPHFCSKLLIGVFLHSHHPLLWNIVSPQQYIFHMYALLECFPQYDIVIFLLSDSNGILVFYLTFYTYQDLLFVNSHKNTYYFQSESTTQVALERENNVALYLGYQYSLHVNNLQQNVINSSLSVVFMAWCKANYYDCFIPPFSHSFSQKCNLAIWQISVSTYI